MREFFQRYGFVVVRDAISAAAVKATEQDILQTAGFDHFPNYKELQTLKWDAISESSYNTKRGFLGFEPAWTQIAWDNRFALYPTYCELFNRSDLVVKLDRYGLMRPTRFAELDDASTTSTSAADSSSTTDVKESGAEGRKKREREGTQPTSSASSSETASSSACPSSSASEQKGGFISRDDWQTESRWLHWDQNPWEEPDFVRIQGLLAISDHRENSGGFHCVPGFASQWQQWAEANKAIKKTGPLVDVPKDDPMRHSIQRITMRPGSAVLWDSRTPHGNFPNSSPGWRMCQYLGFHPAPTNAHPPAIRNNRQRSMQLLARADGMPPKVLSDPLQRRLLGLEPWEEQGPFHTIGPYTMSQIGLED